MIPGTLLPPAQSALERRRRPGSVAKWLGRLAVAVAVVGLVVWYSGYAPFGHQRFDLADGNRRMTFDSAGTYVLFEEYEGASTSPGPSALTVTVLPDNLPDAEISLDRASLDDQSSATYRWLWFDGRELARLTIDTPGTYVVRVAPAEESSPLANRGERTIAVARSGSASWLGSPLGALVLGVVPLVAGVVLLVAARVARRRADDAGSGSGSESAFPVR